MNLGDAVRMLPTPTASIGTHGGPNSRDSSGRPGLQNALQMMGTPTSTFKPRTARFAKGRLPNPAEFAQMFPTPCAQAGKGAGHPASKQGGANLQSVVATYPTVTTGAGLCGGTGNYKRLMDMEALGQITIDERRAMVSPSGQLSPDWVEWLMGLPRGWTDVDRDVPLPAHDPHWFDAEPDIPRVAKDIDNRVARLTCLGNGVVPQQFYPIFAAIAEIETQLCSDT